MLSFAEWERLNARERYREDGKYGYIWVDEEDEKVSNGEK
jgi:hypothetical protein